MRNDGGVFRLHTGTFPRVEDATLGIDLGDLTGDDRLDAVTAQGERGPFLNRVYRGTSALPVDRRPPAVRAIEAAPARGAGGRYSLRVAIVDAHTSDVGPRLDRVWAVTPAGEIDGRFVGGDLFQLDLGATPPASLELCARDRAGNAACGAGQRVTPQAPRTAGSPGSRRTPGTPGPGSPGR